MRLKENDSDFKFSLKKHIYAASHAMSPYAGQKLIEENEKRDNYNFPKSSPPVFTSHFLLVSPSCLFSDSNFSRRRIIAAVIDRITVFIDEFDFD